ncbi:MAG: glycosyltransferase [Fibromonadaceae bacterium]|jgi:glycosyltransferase involved in cell wall biosynthesis|nr:glycosyltransferase [Fibromonadaceae bacterium]
MINDFQQTLKEELQQFLSKQQCKFPETEILKADLHCHDFNSNEPDELLGRILNTPETWIPSQTLLDGLTRNDCNAFTITNHNNARSCYQMQDKGFDILTAAEFSCRVPDFDIGIHVLTYGFAPEQEVKLKKLCKNIYRFLEYARQHNLPTIWAHPLYHYDAKALPPQAFFNKMMLVFERFEMLNGQRDTWQNILVKEWVEQMTPELIDRYAKEFKIDPSVYCTNPYRKFMSGGSDCHMGMFAGVTGTYLHIPNLAERLKTQPKSQLMLEAIRNGNMAPYGLYQHTEKMTIALLNFACQMALNARDPGLVRLLLHKGDTNDKLIAFLISNMLSEVKHHKITTSFIKIFQDCMMGKKPPTLKKLMVNSTYRPIFNEAAEISQVHKRNDSNLVKDYYKSILNINDHFYNILTTRIDKKLGKANLKQQFENASINELINALELPIYLRDYLEPNGNGQKTKINLPEFLDGLSFPFFGSTLLLAAHFASTKTLFNARPILRDFSKRLGKFEHPKRIMWLTDTFGDANGVSTFLKEMHEEIKKRNLPIDIVICNANVQPDEHLAVLKPVKEFSLPAYPDYIFRIPKFVELHNLFAAKNYDRIICSTEGIMGLMGLYLKHAYTIEASFYLHTDWLMFARKVLNIEGHNLSRVRRMLRAFYKAFNNVLVLNSDQKEWLSGIQMNLNPAQVHQTAHWVNERFKPHTPNKQAAFGLDENCKVLLYVGRVSNEKGVLELSEIYSEAKKKFDKTKLVVVGKGPATEQLQKENPDAIFIDWVEQAKLPLIYSSADILVLPSRFDTFAMVVLEALSCGLPVVAYSTKGPKDIIQNNCGFLVETQAEMLQAVIDFLGNNSTAEFQRNAVERAKAYNAENIISELMQSVGMV